MKKTVVLYPGLAVSHFVPMLQLADALLAEGYAVTVALIDPSLKPDIAFSAVVSRVASSNPSVTFHTLPPIQNPPAVTHDALFLARYIDLVSRHNQHLHEFLCSMPPGSVHALVMDALSFEAVDVARKLAIPAYTFFPPSGSALAVTFQIFQLARAQLQGKPRSLKELGDSPLNLHGVPPVPASQYLCGEFLEDPDSEVYKSAMSMERGLLEPDGILVNTFLSLEARAVEALRDRQLFPSLPPVYCVGPLVAGPAVTEEKHECLSWLDKQPDRSVVFLCFGSIGVGNHSKDQLTEIAVGLDKSGHRFLWVVRAPPGHDPEEPVDALLPEGFLERTNGRGLIVKLWAPQVEVLHHRATGAFVTHCGWNSVLEGITAGVPMICWPLYAEQRMNKVFMVEEFGIGVELDGCQQDGLVKAEEVETKVRLVMDSSGEGERLRARVAEHREAAAVAWKDGGTSQVAFSRFLSDAGNVSMDASRP